MKKKNNIVGFKNPILLKQKKTPYAQDFPFTFKSGGDSASCNMGPILWVTAPVKITVLPAFVLLLPQIYISLEDHY